MGEISKASCRECIPDNRHSCCGLLNAHCCALARALAWVVTFSGHCHGLGEHKGCCVGGWSPSGLLGGG